MSTLDDRKAALLKTASFSKKNPFLQLGWDSTSLGLLKECPRKYFYSIIMGWTPRMESVHLRFGLLYHAALERYDHAKAQGADHEAAVIAATRYCLEATTTRGALGVKFWNSDDHNKNRFTLVRTVVWYLEHFKADPAKTIILANGKPAVELSFRFELGWKFNTGEDAILCGHLDRLVEFSDDIWVLDRKTTKNTIDFNFFKKFNPDNQMTLYTLASKVVYATPVKGIIIDGAQIAVSFSRFLRGTTTRHEAELDEWLDETNYWIHQAEYFAERGKWPKNDKSCNNYGGCPFREVCAKSPLVRDKWMENSYMQRTWDPLQVRGDI